MITKFKDQMKLPFSPKDFYKVHKIWVLEVFKHPDLSKSYLLDQRVVFTLNKLLDGNKVTSVPENKNI